MSKKSIIVSENELHTIIKESVKKVLNESDNGLLGEDELMEYARLRPNKTGLGMDIFVDDGHTYERWNHPLWLYVRNGYHNENEFFPVNITNNSKLPDIDYHLTNEDLNGLIRFISINMSMLVGLANEEIDHEDFYQNVKPISVINKPNQMKESLNEMSKLRTEKSGLPTELWVDEGSSPQHGPRVKFKASNEQRNTNEYSSMSISDEPEVFYFPKRSFLTSKDIDKIKRFVILNKELLLSLCEENGITFEQFLKLMRKV